MTAEHVASHLGKATYLSIVLRSVAHQAARRRCLLPLDVLARHKVSQEAVYESAHSGPPAALLDAVFDVAKQGRAHVLHAEQIAGVPDEAQRVQRLQFVVLKRVFERLERVGFDPFLMRANTPYDVWLPFHLWRAT